MKLVVDANILVAELTRKRGRILIADSKLELFIAEKPWEEVRHELRKRFVIIAERKGATSQEASELYKAAIMLASVNVQVMPVSYYVSLEKSAKRRIPRDPDDWHSVALALVLNADIWTQDNDFLGCGVATWTTDTLIEQLHQSE